MKTLSVIRLDSFPYNHKEIRMATSFFNQTFVVTIHFQFQKVVKKKKCSFILKLKLRLGFRLDLKDINLIIW